MLSNKEKKQYINSVSRKIKCNKKDKADVLAYISSAVDDLVVQNPDITSADLIRSIGEPEAAAKSFSEMIPAKAFVKKRTCMIIIILSVICAVIAASLIALHLYLTYDQSNVHRFVLEPGETWTLPLELHPNE